MGLVLVEEKQSSNFVHRTSAKMQMRLVRLSAFALVCLIGFAIDAERLCQEFSVLSKLVMLS